MKKVSVYPVIVIIILFVVFAICTRYDRKGYERTENALMQDWCTVRAEAEERAERDGNVIQSVMSAVMAAATNNIADTEPGSLMDCIDATCRVKTVTAGPAHSVGPGVVFKIDDDAVYVLTNAHVATTKTMKLEFWRDGHKLDAVTGKVTLRDAKRDVAVISVPKSAFNDYLPTAIPLAPRGTMLEDGVMIMSAGCPKATWTRAWIGHVENTKNDRVAFQPGPYGGQSGSALFSASGSEIVALLNLQERSSKNGPIIRGYAVTLENIYIAVYGKEGYYTKTQWRKKPNQCGPKGCPDQGNDERDPLSQGLGDLLPDDPIPLMLPEIVPELPVPSSPGIARDIDGTPIEGVFGPPEPVVEEAAEKNLQLSFLECCFWGVRVAIVILASFFVLFFLLTRRR